MILGHWNATPYLNLGTSPLVLETVPEPISVVLVVLGLGAVVWCLRRRTGVLPLMLLTAFSASVLGQGQFTFNNRVGSNPPEIDACFVLPTDPPGTSTVGMGFQVQLFAGPEGTPLNELLPTDRHRRDSVGQPDQQLRDTLQWCFQPLAHSDLHAFQQGKDAGVQVLRDSLAVGVDEFAGLHGRSSSKHYAPNHRLARSTRASISLHLLRPPGQGEVDHVDPGQHPCQNRPQDGAVSLPGADDGNGRAQANAGLGDGGRRLRTDLGEKDGIEEMHGSDRLRCFLGEQSSGIGRDVTAAV